jgi:hypothetical protein
MLGYYTGPSPVFPGYQQAPVIGGVAPVQPPEQAYEAPATVYPTTPQYVPSYPRYLPTQGGGLAGSTFRPPYWGAPARMRHGALGIAAFIVTACTIVPDAPQTVSTDPIEHFEGLCMQSRLEVGDVSGAQGCIDLADRMRERRAPQPPADVQSISTPAQRATASARSQGIQITIERADHGRGVVLTLSGVIGPGDAQRVLAAVHEIRTNYADATEGAIFLNSPGGSVTEASVIAAIGASGIPVAVPKYAQCASACFLIFASAINKFASPTARIGVHSVVDGVTGQETEGARAVTTELARACSERGVPPSIIGRMVTTPPGRVAWLTEAELLSMGVRMIPPEFDD